MKIFPEERRRIGYMLKVGRQPEMRLAGVPESLHLKRGIV